MALEDDLKSIGFGLHDMNLQAVKVSNLNDPNTVKGRIAEEYVYQWLDMCPDVVFDDNFPRIEGDYIMDKRECGILLRSKENPCQDVWEFDHSFFYDGVPYVSQVKSGKLHRLFSRIPRELELAKTVYDCSVRLVLFFPFLANSDDICRIEAEYTDVTCVDLGYRKREMANAVDSFYRLNRHWHGHRKR